MKIIESILAGAADIAAVRRDIHAHPELCFQEVRTADVVAQKLESWGIPFTAAWAPPAWWASCTAATAAPAAAPSACAPTWTRCRCRSSTNLPMPAHSRARCTPAAMTATPPCCWPRRAIFSQNRDFDGTVYLIFQPAEEGGGGAREMIKDGLFEKFPVEAVFGMHNWPGAPVGTFAVSAGPVMASSNEFKITIRGKGGHAAMPHTGIDPVPVACQMVQGFQNIISRNKKPVDAGVISVTMIHAGEATNVVPDFCELQGTVRTFSIEVLDLIEKRMKEVAEHTCAAFEARCEFSFTRNYPPTVNSAAEADFARQVMSDIVGPANVLAQEPTMGAEDFAYMLQAKPGAYCFISNGDGAHREMGHGEGPCTLHNPSYDFNDDLIPLGGTYWVQLATRWLGTAARA
jgi:amidohydrolase